MFPLKGTRRYPGRNIGRGEPFNSAVESEGNLKATPSNLREAQEVKLILFVGVYMVEWKMLVTDGLE